MSLALQLRFILYRCHVRFKLVKNKAVNKREEDTIENYNRVTEAIENAIKYSLMYIEVFLSLSYSHISRVLGSRSEVSSCNE